VIENILKHARTGIKF